MQASEPKSQGRKHLAVRSLPSGRKQRAWHPVGPKEKEGGEDGKEKHTSEFLKQLSSYKPAALTHNDCFPEKEASFLGFRVCFS